MSRCIAHIQITNLGTARPLGYGYSRVATCPITAGGLGYRPGDQITVDGTWTISPSVKVLSVNSAGAVLSLMIMNPGYVASGSKPSAPIATTGGQGTGLTVTPTYTDDVIPPGASSARFQCEAQACRYRDDGTAPTSGVGFTLATGVIVDYDKAGSLANVKVIEATSGAKLNVSFYGE